MKKRIIASTMASVMALSGAASALVASADLGVKTEAVTVSQLRSFLEKNERIIELRDNGGLEQYGSVSGEKFTKALEYANAVIENGKATDDDATVAFQMVKAAEKNLVQHDKIELQALVAECTPDYKTQNELNDAGDEIWESDTWLDFETEYITGFDVQESDDILATTDAYDKLKEAHDNLSEKATRTKSQIVAARKAYEKALDLEFKYQPWARGSVKGSGTKYDGNDFAWGKLYQHISSGNANLVAAYKQFDEMKGVAVTSNKTIVDAVDVMEQAAKVLTGFTPNTVAGGSDTQIRSLLKTYSGQLVYTYKAAEVADIVNDLVSAAGGTAGNIQFLLNTGKFIDGDDGTIAIDDTSKATYWNVVENSKHIVLSAQLKIKLKNTAANDVYYVLSKDKKVNSGYNALLGNDSNTDGTIDQWFWNNKAAAQTFANANNGSVKSIIKGGQITLSDFIGTTADEVVAGSSISVTDPASEKSALSTQLTAIKTACDALDSGLDAVSTEVDGFAGTATSDSATDLTSAHKTEILGLISTALGAVTALTQAVAAATGASPNLTPTYLDDIESKYTTAKSAVKAVTDLTYFAALGSSSNIVDSSASPAVDLPKDLDDLFVTNGDYTTAASAYEAAYNAEVIKNAWGVNSAASNSACDGSAETFSNAFSYKYDGTNKTFTFAAYTSSKDPEGSNITTASLPAALTLVESFRAKNWDGITKLDNINTIIDQTGVDRTNSTPRTPAWNMLYNYLKYALEDMFKGSSDTTYTLKDVQDLVEDSYKLAEETAETALFKGSHVALVNDRTGAAEWVKLALDEKKAKTYIENFTDFDIYTRKTSGTTAFNSTTMYKWLNDSYKQLSDEKKAFAYSYDEIIKTMADIAEKVDKGEFSDSVAKTLLKDLDDAALKMIALGTDSGKLSFSVPVDDENQLFNDDGTMNKHNRLFTYGKDFSLTLSVDATDGSFNKVTVSKNNHHDAMKKAYEKLLKDYDAATAKPEDKVVDDVNGDTKINMLDVQELLRLVVNEKGEVAKHDFNKDGKVNMLDVQALLTKVVNMA